MTLLYGRSGRMEPWHALRRMAGQASGALACILVQGELDQEAEACVNELSPIK